QMSYTMSETTV
ncbi:hypothetical protein A2U01_0109997, partial [Trifolium medium]|nr:hypothetical protein [Trifolium medium]